MKAKELSERMGDAHNVEGATYMDSAIKLIHHPDYQYTYEKVMPFIASSERRFDYGFLSGFTALVFHCLLEMDRLPEGFYFSLKSDVKWLLSILILIKSSRLHLVLVLC